MVKPDTVVLGLGLATGAGQSEMTPGTNHRALGIKAKMLRLWNGVRSTEGSTVEDACPRVAQHGRRQLSSPANRTEKQWNLDGNAVGWEASELDLQHVPPPLLIEPHPNQRPSGILGKGQFFQVLGEPSPLAQTAYRQVCPNAAFRSSVIACFGLGRIVRYAYYC